MLTVLTPEEVIALIQNSFPLHREKEYTPLTQALGRVLWEDMTAEEYVPDFDRSSVDGYAIHGSDSFGCSDAMPALLRLTGEIAMGEPAGDALQKGCCAAVPTGGAVPSGADAVAMLEYTEVLEDGIIALSKPTAPGENMVYRGDDLSPGQVFLTAGRRLTAADIGALAALGVTELPVCRRPTVAILSTGDELVGVDEKPGAGQVRNVNSVMLSALVRSMDAVPMDGGVIRDDEALLSAALDRALAECDIVLVSGGSSVGAKDALCRVVEKKGELLMHGVAMKPGKPTILGRIRNKPVLGLPGHPAAAWFAASLFLPELLSRCTGKRLERRIITAELAEKVSANHGRAQYMAVTLEGKAARPIRSKSGLITALAGADGWFCIPRDCEGYAAGQSIEVTLMDGQEG